MNKQKPKRKNMSCDSMCANGYDFGKITIK